MGLSKIEPHWRLVLVSAALCFLSGSLIPVTARAQTSPEDLIRRLVPTTPEESPAPSTESLLEGSVDPATYLLGPGDRFHIQSTGGLNFDLSPRVDPEGWLSLGSYGSVRLGGFTLEQGRGRIHDLLSRQIRNATVDVRLLDIRRFKVYVLGEVRRPGAYPATAATRASEVISLAGGLGDSAAVRSIRILRAGQDTAVDVDLAAFRIAGDLSDNPFLADGDRIVVPRRSRWFSISGAVEHEGMWDLREGESLKDVLTWVGLRTSADLTWALVARFSVPGPDGLYDRFDTLTVALDRVLAGGETFLLADGDRVYIRPKPRFQIAEEVCVEGAVRHPGMFPIQEGVSRLSEVITWAGGTLPGAQSNRVTIVRPVRADTTGLTELPPPGSPIYSLDRAELARLRLGTSPDAQRMTLDLAGDEDLLVMNGDKIIVPHATRFVRVTGEVVSPGFYPHQKGWDLGDYLGAAGGTTKYADRGRSRLLRGSMGTTTQASRAPDIASGDIIFVPERERTDRTGWETFRDIFGIAAQVATVILVIDQVTK